MKRLVILISGRGSNMQAIAEACARERWPARIAAVIASRPGAAGLAWAEARGIPTRALDHRAHADRAVFDAELARSIDELGGDGQGHGPDLVVLAGFMRILGADFVRRYAGRLINIHPSLLPSFAGLHTHQRAIDAGCVLAGATVHLVTPELDHGPIVAQAAVPVLPGDDAASLSDRVLGAEHLIYPRALRWWVEGQLEVQGLRVRHIGSEPQWLIAPQVE
ncbi:MAG: phosphoribosylglycinamide formyltransferase [Burkholderiales bacterium]|nr:phosphoribosylglycinamide formyltransferase [Burkholderiales bacterium]